MLVGAANERGFAAHSVTRLRRLRGRGDHIIARYSIDNDLILVTGNMVDFERIYVAREMHPGLVCLNASGTKLRTLRYQLAMLGMALDLIEEDEPVQEIIVVDASPHSEGGVQLSADRYHLPDL